MDISVFYENRTVKLNNETKLIKFVYLILTTGLKIAWRRIISFFFNLFNYAFFLVTHIFAKIQPIDYNFESKQSRC